MPPYNIGHKEGGDMQKFFLLIAVLIGVSLQARAEEPVYWMKAKATNKFERTKVAEIGVAIEAAMDDYVIATGTKAELKKLQDAGLLLHSFAYPMSKTDFPAEDSNFHNYNETLDALKDLSRAAPSIVSYEVIGKSLEGRDIVNIRISGNLKESKNLPAVVFMGAHHAREHVSTEIPLMLAQHLIAEFQKGNKSVMNLINSREINIIPMVNPDGVEYDISTGNYAGWRKNRRQNKNGTYGVDLNRNYGFKWGETGASGTPSSETYYGESAFSEPETQAIKAFIESHENINVLLSFHTFSELILYPWGWTYDSISDQKDKAVFEKLAKTMAGWNKYTPQQGSDLYLVSGETGDWAYSQHKIFSFTFELDPKFAFGVGGFYPGQAKLPGIFAKNLPACMYLIEYADNPYRVLTPSIDLGMSTPLIH
jgi:carboxypeptidase T